MTTNLERASIGMSMGIWDGTPAPLLQADSKGQEGVATNPERTGTGMGMGIEYGKPAPHFEQKKKNRTGEPPS